MIAGEAVFDRHVFEPNRVRFTGGRTDILSRRSGSGQAGQPQQQVSAEAVSAAMRHLIRAELGDTTRSQNRLFKLQPTIHVRKKQLRSGKSALW